MISGASMATSRSSVSSEGDVRQLVHHVLADRGRRDAVRRAQLVALDDVANQIQQAELGDRALPALSCDLVLVDADERSVMPRVARQVPVTLRTSCVDSWRHTPALKTTNRTVRNSSFTSFHSDQLAA
jgi:hypothetical protein